MESIYSERCMSYDDLRPLVRRAMARLGILVTSPLAQNHPFVSHLTAVRG